MNRSILLFPTTRLVMIRTVFRRLISFFVLLGLLACLPPVVSALQMGKRENGDNDKTQQRLREGTELSDQAGEFQLTGDRVTFYPADGGPPMRALENLALERIALVLGDSRTRRTWNVSGLVTEYRGINFLLVQQARLKAGGGD